MSSPERRPSVWLALPHVGSLSPWTAAASQGPYATENADLHVMHFGFSIATHTFNHLWCEAYNHRKELGLTHFAMMHADIHPEEKWLDTLLFEMGRTGADILSCVVAMKDTKGLTSTGLRDPETRRTRRLTMAEVHVLPGTFSAASTDQPDDVLAINTGLWVCRFDESWVLDFPGFSIANRLEHDPATDTLKPHTDPEDWRFSHWAHQHGLKVMATRKVKVWHAGLFQFPNDAPWGEWQTDREYFGTT